MPALQLPIYSIDVFNGFSAGDTFDNYRDGELQARLRIVEKRSGPLFNADVGKPIGWLTVEPVWINPNRIEKQ